MLKSRLQNGAQIRSWLATVLIARDHYQEAKMKLKRSRGNMGYKRKRPSFVKIHKMQKKKKKLRAKKNRRH